MDKKTRADFLLQVIGYKIVFKIFEQTKRYSKDIVLY